LKSLQKYDLSELKKAFKGNIASKIISQTDINKAAYVVPREQKKILDRAGMKPGNYRERKLFPLHVLGTDEVIQASYYGSERKGSGRPPEFRMGRIMEKLREGDELVIATDGRDVFICTAGHDVKETSAVREDYEKTATKIAEELPYDKLVSRVKTVNRKPSTRSASTTVYERDGTIIAFARRRSGYRCETPGCGYEGFIKDDGKKYIETHHITPLSEKGLDSPYNVAAVCPNCHAVMHYSGERKKLSEKLRAAVREANKKSGLKEEDF
jgi:5-methylcytosine-specific restriction endonuclease McrA